MTGFLRGLFGGKGEDEMLDQPSQGNGAYFLDDNQAKTLGNLDYMRQTKTIRRTFPKITEKGKEEFSQTSDVSAMNKMTTSGNASLAATNGTAAAPLTPKEAEARRRVDTSLDMFRNMAKEIRK